MSKIGTERSNTLFNIAAGLGTKAISPTLSVISEAVGSNRTSLPEGFRFGFGDTSAYVARSAGSSGNNGAMSTTSWGNAGAKAYEHSGTVDVAGRAQASKATNPTDSAHKISPDSFEHIGNLQNYYGHNPFGTGQFDFARAGRFKIEDTAVQSDSKLLNYLGQDEAHKTWNAVRQNLVAGKDGKGLFADDAHLSTALNHTIDKFNARGTSHEFQAAMRNADVLSNATAFNISEKGIHDNGLGRLYEAYSQVDNNLPTNILSRQYISAFNQAMQQSGGNIVAALEQAKQYDTKTHGNLELATGQVKSLAHTVNEHSFRNMAESLGLDSNMLEQRLADINGIQGENKFYDINGAVALSTALDSGLLQKDENGKTGFQRLVDESKAQYGGNFEAHVTFGIRPKGDAKTDGTAFMDFSQNGAQALASLQKHIAGLTDNPMLANQFNFVFQDENNYKEYAPQILQAMQEAGIDVTKLTHAIEGHGSAGSGAMIKSGVVGQDYQGIDQDDSKFMASLLQYTPELRQNEVLYDSCHGLHPAKHNAEAMNAEAQRLGLNLATTYEGSDHEGLVLAHSGGESNQKDRLVHNADGTVAAESQRIDDGGTDHRATLFSQGEKAFQEEMQQVREQKSQVVASTSETTEETAS